MTNLLVSLNAIVSALCFLMALHLFTSRAAYPLAARFLGACFVTLALNALFLGLSLATHNTTQPFVIQPAAIQAVAAILFPPASFLAFKAAFDTRFRLTFMSCCHAIPALVLMGLWGSDTGQASVDLVLLTVLLSYAIAFTYLAIGYRSLGHKKAPAGPGHQADFLQSVYRWLLVFMAYAWFNFFSDLLIFLEVREDGSNLRSIALGVTILFKLALVSATLFYALQKSPTFEWLYWAMSGAVQKTKDPDKIAGYGPAIDALEAALQDPALYTQEFLSLMDMAKRLGIPARLLSNAINHHTGESYSRYMNRKRIQMAEQILIKSPDMPMLEVMFRAGFRTKSSFNKEFKAITGQSPSAYRKMSGKTS